MFSTIDILFGVVLPGLLTLAVALAAWRPWRKRDLPAPRGGWSAAVIPAAFALAYYLVLFWQVNDSPRFPPIDTIHYLFFAALALPLIAAVDGLLARGETTWKRFAITAAARAALGAGLAALVLPRLLKPIIEHTWQGNETFTYIALFAAAVGLIWLSLGALTDHAKGAGVPVALSVAAACTAVVLMMSGSQKFGQIAGMLTAALGGVALVSLWARRYPTAHGLAAPLAFLHTLLLLAGYYFASLTAQNALLLAIAPHAAWAGDLPGVRRMPPWARSLMRVLAVAITAGIAVAFAAVKFAHDMAEDPYANYY